MKADGSAPHPSLKRTLVYVYLWITPEDWDIEGMDYCTLSAKFCVTNSEEIRVLDV
jgi:hypothetical protein